MDNESKSRAEQVALFRYGLIADLIHLAPGAGRAGHNGLYAKLRDKAAIEYAIPGSRRTRVAAETIRGWLRDYREHGFDGLLPKPRADIGSARHIPQEVVDLLVALKDEHRDWAVSTVIGEARRMAAAGEADVPESLALPTSTVHRLLARAGVMDKPVGDPTTKDRRRFAYDRAGELWMSDVMHGPTVLVDGRRRQKTYLVALLDDATRVVPFCAFALSENTSAFLPVLEQGVMRRGIPKRLYVDNGSAYRSHHLALVCARLGITLVHARPYSPQGKGKQERWFRTVRMQLCSTLGDADRASLDALNRRLWAWVEGEYHHAPHKGLEDKTPFDAWAMSSSDVRVPGPELDLRDMFLFEQKRKVHTDRTVSLHGTTYEVDASLVGETVILRYSPSKPGGPVDVWHRGKKIQTAKRVDVHANCFIRRGRGPRIDSSRPSIPPDAALRLRDLRKRNDDHGGR
jgi:transposase InsO family protein